MSRFDCPQCNRSLRFRLLPHVPRDDGRFAFSCIHCGAVLEYTEDHLPLAEPFLRTRLRSVGTLIGGLVLFSGIALYAGRAVSTAAVGLLAAVLLGAYLFSKKPVYRVIGK
jgi:hypothetical protein